MCTGENVWIRNARIKNAWIRNAWTKAWLLRRAAALVALSLFATAVAVLPARAADPVFPLGSRVGLVPPSGMVMSKKFAGFADPKEDAAIVITTLPQGAFAEIEKSFDTDAFKKQGVTVEKREPIKLAVGTGFLISARQTIDEAHYRKWLLVVPAGDMTALVSIQVPEQNNTYSEATLRAALATLAVRASVPQDEELGLLPFTIGDLAGFKIGGVLPGRAIILGDAPPDHADGAPKPAPPVAPQDAAKETASPAPKEPAPGALEARLLIAVVPGGPAQLDDHASFAREMFNEIGGITNIHVSMSEPLRIGGQPGFQTMAQAKDARSGADVMVVQWLRFGGGGFLQMTGIARTDNWTATLARLRAVRDSVEAR
jgi:hypothetical protein